MRLLPALEQIRDKVQDTLVANSKSWAAPGAYRGPHTILAESLALFDAASAPKAM